MKTLKITIPVLLLILVCNSCSIHKNNGISLGTNSLNTRNYAFTDHSDTIKKGRTSIFIESKASNKIVPLEAKLNKNITAQSDSASSTDRSNWDCYTRTISINSNSSTFMTADYSSQGQFIYPGAIYQYSDFKSGNYQVISGKRNKITLTTDNPNMKGGTSIEINNPNITNIREGISKLYSNFDNSSIGTMNLRYQTYEANSEAEMSLRISGNFSYLTSSFENEYKNTQKTTHHYITVDIIKPLYTINTVMGPNLTHFKQPINATNPLIISSVTYGLRILANFDLKTTTKEELDNFRAKYSSIATNGSLDLEYLTKEANTEQTINCYVVGGAGTSTVAFNKDQFQEGIRELISTLTYGTARPISFTLADLTGKIIETKSSTDDIVNQVCLPHTNIPKLESAFVKIRTGDQNKDHNTTYSVFLRKGINGSLHPSGDWSAHNHQKREYKSGDLSVLNFGDSAKVLMYNDFLNSNGGSLMFKSFTKGDDTWTISHVDLVLIFADGRSETVSFNQPFSISDEAGEYVLFFNRSFKAI